MKAAWLIWKAFPSSFFALISLKLDSFKQIWSYNIGFFFNKVSAE